MANIKIVLTGHNNERGEIPSKWQGVVYVDDQRKELKVTEKDSELYKIVKGWVEKFETMEW